MRLDQNSYFHHFGIFTQSPITISSFLLFSHIIFEDFVSPKTIQDKVLSLKKSCFQNNSSTPSSDLLTGAFSKFGVFSLPLSSAFNRLSSKEGHLWTPQIFQSFVKMTFLPLAPSSEKIKAISNFSYSSDFLDWIPCWYIQTRFRIRTQCLKSKFEPRYSIYKLKL